MSLKKVRMFHRLLLGLMAQQIFRSLLMLLLPVLLLQMDMFPVVAAERTMAQSTTALSAGIWLDSARKTINNYEKRN